MIRYLLNSVPLKHLRLHQTLPIHWGDENLVLETHASGLDPLFDVSARQSENLGQRFDALAISVGHVKTRGV
jgi:hypothetical protein